MARTRIPLPPPTCPHIPNGDDDSSEALSATHYDPNVECWEHREWVRVVRQILIKLPLPTKLVEYFEDVMLPYDSEKEDYFPEGLSVGSMALEDRGSRFPRFTELPPELRRIIWIYAIQPRLLFAVLPYGEEAWGLPLSLPLALPGPAYACREARQSILSEVSICPLYASVDTPPRAHRISSRDIVYFPTIETMSVQDPAIHRDIPAHSFRHIAIDYWDIMNGMDTALAGITPFGTGLLAKSTWSWLKDMQSLESLTLITNTCNMVLGRDQNHESELISEEDEYRTVTDIILLEDIEQFERLSHVWRSSGESMYLDKQPYVGGFMFGADGALVNTVNCLDCEMEMWELDFQSRFMRAWLKLLARQEELPDQEEVFRADGGVLDMSIP